jgi:hypothetical protein
MYLLSIRMSPKIITGNRGACERTDLGIFDPQQIDIATMIFMRVYRDAHHIRTIALYCDPALRRRSGDLGLAFTVAVYGLDSFVDLQTHRLLP